MKKWILCGAALFTVLATVSCSNDSDDDTGPIVPPTTTVSYTTDVKPIIDGNCVSCHANPPINNAPNSLVTFNDVKTAVESKNLISRIENGSMPPNGSLTSGQITTIKNWRDGGFAQ